MTNRFARRTFAWVLLLALTGACSCADRPEAASDAAATTSTKIGRPPNVILILADDLGWGDLGCYGHPDLRTPNLDRLARQGTLFTQFYVSSPVCSASRAAFLSGRFPSGLGIHGVIENKQLNHLGQPLCLDAGVPNVARMLKDAGYATGHFGKWHLGQGDGTPGPGGLGFDAFNTRIFWEKGDPYGRAKSSKVIVDESIRFIEENRQRPFYLNVWSLVPHATLNPTEEQMEPYKHLAPDDNVPHKGAMHIYFASVSDLDEQIGRLLLKLD